MPATTPSIFPAPGELLPQLVEARIGGGVIDDGRVELILAMALRDPPAPGRSAPALRNIALEMDPEQARQLGEQLLRAAEILQGSGSPH